MTIYDSLKDNTFQFFIVKQMTVGIMSKSCRDIYFLITSIIAWFKKNMPC